MSNLAVFVFDSHDIRFVDGKPIANDVASVLGYADPAKTVSTKVFPENRSVTKTVTVDGKCRSVMILEEAGIYQLIFSSKLESAKRFQQWVFSEVLPSIRKTGSYGQIPQPPQTYLEALKALVSAEEEKALLTAKIEQNAPLVAYAETVQASEDAIEFNEFAKMIGTGRTRLFRLLREVKVIMKNTTLPYQNLCDAGYFEVSQEVTDDGKLRPFALVTGKGQIWLKQKIDSHLNQQKRFAQLLVQGTLGI